MRVNLPNIMKEAASTCRTSAITMAFQIANAALLRMAKRAVELNDPELQHELVDLGYLVEVEDPPQG